MNVRFVAWLRALCGILRLKTAMFYFRIPSVARKHLPVVW